MFLPEEIFDADYGVSIYEEDPELSEFEDPNIKICSFRLGYSEKSAKQVLDVFNLNLCNYGTLQLRICAASVHLCPGSISPFRLRC